MDNLVLLCRRHHRFVHERGYSVERLSNGKVRFRDSWGFVVRDVPRDPFRHVQRLPEVIVDPLEEAFDDPTKLAGLLEPGPVAAALDDLDDGARDQFCGVGGRPQGQRVEVAVDEERGQTNVGQSAFERSRFEVALE